MIQRTVRHQRYASFLGLVASATALLVGTILLIELLYHRSSGASEPLSLWGFSLDHQGVFAWLIAVVVVLAGMVTIKPAGRALLAQLADDTAQLEGAEQ